MGVPQKCSYASGYPCSPSPLDICPYQADTSALYRTSVSDMCTLDVRKAAAKHFCDNPRIDILRWAERPHSRRQKLRKQRQPA